VSDFPLMRRPLGSDWHDTFDAPTVTVNSWCTNTTVATGSLPSEIKWTNPHITFDSVRFQLYGLDGRTYTLTGRHLQPGDRLDLEPADDGYVLTVTRGDETFTHQLRPDEQDEAA